MKKIRMIAGFALIAGLVLAAEPGAGAILLRESFDKPLQADNRFGELATVKGKLRWTAGGGYKDIDHRRFLAYPIEGNVNPDAGTIEFDLIRREQGVAENLCAFMDSRGRRLATFAINWKTGVLSRGPNTMPSVQLDSLPPYSLWYVDVRHLNMGVNFDGNIPFNGGVAKGSRVHMAFTWGPDPADCAIYVNGGKLSAIVPEPFGLPGIIRASSMLVVGTRPWEGTSGGTELLNSTLGALRVSDVPLRPSQMLFAAPRIISIGHDGGKVSGFSGYLVEGQKLTVTMEAEPGGAASCDVGDIRDLALTEDAGKPGRYTGTYTVAAGDYVDKGSVVGRFRNLAGMDADPLAASREVYIDGRVHLAVKPSNDLVPADRKSKVGITVVATDANGKKLREHPLKLTLSTTDEYTGLAGSGTFEDLIGGKVETDWGGVTDAFGEVTAQYQAGFAAKTVVVNAKDLLSGGIGFGVIRSFIQGSVDISVREPAVRRLQALRGTLEVWASREWLTADGSSRSRITARVLDTEGKPVQGDQVSFSLMGDRGQVRVVQGRTDSSGKAFADYIAGTVIGQVQVEVRDLTLGLSALIAIELRSDAPAEVLLRAEPSEIFVGGPGSIITAKVRDANGNPNSNTEVGFDFASGSGSLSSSKVLTDALEGKASVSFLPGNKAGNVTVRATVISRVPTGDELENARGAAFLYGQVEDPGVLTLKEWKVETKDQVVKGQELAVLEDRSGTTYLLRAPRDGILSVREVEIDEETLMGETLAYILPVSGS